MNIRKAQLSDLNTIESLDIACFGQHKHNWQKTIEDPASIMLVAMEDDQLAGFSGIMWQEYRNAFEVVNVYTHPDHRKKGIATTLIAELIEEAQKTEARTILAQAPNGSLINKLYEKVGFQSCGYHTRWYANDDQQKALFWAFDLK